MSWSMIRFVILGKDTSKIKDISVGKSVIDLQGMVNQHCESGHDLSSSNTFKT